MLAKPAPSVLCYHKHCGRSTQVTEQAGSADAQPAKVLLPLITNVGIVDKHLHNRVYVASVAPPVFQREPWHSMLPKDALRERL